ncbi:hypothetical protein DERP_012179, partial [Dermatophagoides pteronyssinus]
VATKSKTKSNELFVIEVTLSITAITPIILFDKNNHVCDFVAVAKAMAKAKSSLSMTATKMFDMLM